MRVFRTKSLSLLLGCCLLGCNGGDDKAPCESDPSLCEDGIVCTSSLCMPIDSHADENGCLINPDDVLCEDGASCTYDVCSPDSPLADQDGCTHQQFNSACDDGASCTEGDCEPSDPTANEETGCVFTLDDAACDDSASCTTDSCDPDNPDDEATGCVNLPDESVCNDELDCTVDLCAPGDVFADPQSGCVNQSCGCDPTTPISGAGQYSADTTGLTDSMRPPADCAGPDDGAGPEAAFVWDLLEPANVGLDTSASAVERTLIYIFKDCQPPAILCADGGEEQASLEADLTTGSYTIYVDGSTADDAGSITLDVTIH